METSVPYGDMSVAELLDLIEEILDSIPVSVDALDVPAWHLEELEKRLARRRRQSRSRHSLGNRQGSLEETAMTVPVVTRSEAEEDLAEARDWYENNRVGLGDEFLDSAEKFFERISEFPELYAIVVKNIRRGKLDRFPYVVYYRFLKDKIEVLAVLHGRRDAKAWRRRIKSL